MHFLRAIPIQRLNFRDRVGEGGFVWGSEGLQIGEKFKFSNHHKEILKVSLYSMAETTLGLFATLSHIGNAAPVVFIYTSLECVWFCTDRFEMNVLIVAHNKGKIHSVAYQTAEHKWDKRTKLNAKNKENWQTTETTLSAQNVHNQPKTNKKKDQPIAWKKQ